MTITGRLPTMSDLSMFLRDFHSAAVIAIDVEVIDFLAAVMDAVDAQNASILSAYRTPETKVAENSQHLYGHALDVRLGTRLADAMQAARAMKRGGVGWYPHSGFLHIDTGPVRNWDLDESRLDSLLISGWRLRRKDGEELSGGGSARYTSLLERSGLPQPGLERSGRLLPGMEHSGLPQPGMERSGRALPRMERSGLPQPGIERGSRILPGRQRSGLRRL